MGESYMYQRLPYTRGEGEGEDEEERSRRVEGQMVKSQDVDRCVFFALRKCCCGRICL